MQIVGEGIRTIRSCCPHHWGCWGMLDKLVELFFNWEARGGAHVGLGSALWVQFPNVVPRPSTLAASRNLLEIHIPGSTPDQLMQRLWAWGPSVF